MLQLYMFVTKNKKILYSSSVTLLITKAPSTGHAQKIDSEQPAISRNTQESTFLFTVDLAPLLVRYNLRTERWRQCSHVAQ